MQLGRYSLITIICLSMLSCASPKMSQELQAGKNAFQSGYYKDAFHRLLPLAVKGKPEAQYAVGYMYYYGYGVSQDNESGIFWMEKAADQNYAPAKTALDLIHQSDIAEKKEQSRRDERDQRDAVMQTLRVQRGKDAPIKVTPRRIQKTAQLEAETQDQSPIEEAEAAPQLEQPAQPPEPVRPVQNVAEDHVSSPRNFTLQLYGSYHLTDVKGLQSELRLKNTGHIYQTSHNGKDWYVLTFGNFVTVHEASATKNNLPHGLKQMDPWVRKVDSLKMV